MYDIRFMLIWKKMRKYLLEMDENDQRHTQRYQTQHVSYAINVKW